MKNVKRKLVSLLLTVIILTSLFSFSSCNRNYDEEEVVAATKELLKNAEILNEVYYGSGIRYYDVEIEDAGYYKRADSEHLSELGFSNIEELKALTEKTFSYNYSQNIYSTILYGFKEEGMVVSAARYYQYTEQETNESYIMVYTRFEPLLKDSISYDYDSVRADKSKKEYVYVSVDATVTNSSGESQKVTISITLFEEESGWRICNPTYANYNASNDRYNELQNKK
jgi:hypothetical protein